MSDISRDWHHKAFAQLSLTELYALLQLRSKVFVVEQNCPYQDLDDKDQEGIHLWCSNEQGMVIACCRLLPAGVSYPEASIGRVVTDPAIRGKNTGRQLMERAIRYISEQWHAPSIHIGAQLYLQRFYESLSFERISDVYDEDGIPHIEMLLRC